MSQQRLESTESIDLVETSEIVRLIQTEDATIHKALEAARSRLVLAIDQIHDRLAAGGRLHYVGAGTSGRIAMLDAAEIPPTYGTDPKLVNVIMAGGREAFLSAAEGAEDREEDAISAVNEHVSDLDAVVGVAASGTTPYTLAAIRRANMIGALTVSVTARAPSPLAAEADIAIELDTGPEVIMGSTRMKAGTAQKLALNTISTAVMIKLGRTYSNLMIDMPATNAKLRSRAESIVELATGRTKIESRKLLDQANGDKRIAVVMGRLGLGREEAEQRLLDSGGNLREALGE